MEAQKYEEASSPRKEYVGRLLTVILFSVLSAAGFGFSIYLFYVANSIYMIFLAIFFTILSLFAGFFNIYASIWYFRSYFYTGYLKKITDGLKPMESLPKVALVMPVYNEDPEMVERNLKELWKMNYPKAKLEVFVADDSTEQDYINRIERSCGKLGVTFVHRKERKGYKAGAINNIIYNLTDAPFFAVFDADEYLSNPNFLKDLLPYFQDDKLAYVQTEKRYAKGTFFSDCVDIFDAFFFKFIQPARALDNTAIFAGSCGLINKSAFMEIGGFPEYVIEDTFFSFESDMHGFKSIYIQDVYALGRPVRSFTELAKMQWRYNYGDTQFISYYFQKKGYTKRKTPFSVPNYVTHGLGLNYISIFLILFTIASIGITFTAVPFAHIDVFHFLQTNTMQLDLELLGFFAFTLSLLTPALLTRIYFKSWAKGLMVFLLNYALAFVRTKAALATLINKNPGMHWNKLKYMGFSGNALSSLRNTGTEVVFASMMFVLAYFALAQSNIAGGIWLTWYGFLYLLATAFLYKYG
jgi:cellulose synthase/poly-beta-1,6-N-acetylglucosamine synthase-like glycosyltransferase